MKTKHKQTKDQLEIINNGLLIKTAYGISPFFEWKLYKYKGKRYNVSMFSDEIDKIEKDYCNVCGKGTYNIQIVFGQYTCPECGNEIN